MKHKQHQDRKSFKKFALPNQLTQAEVLKRDKCPAPSASLPVLFQDKGRMSLQPATLMSSRQRKAERARTFIGWNGKKLIIDGRTRAIKVYQNL